jgi:hypothetical protein
MRMGVTCSIHGTREIHTEVLSKKPEGKRQSARPRHRWEDNTKMNLNRVDWIHLAQDMV